jgi:membrane associated rhomboid family serine protease
VILIPIHRKPDWSRPPWITALLILINLMVFVFFQGDDEQHLEAAAHIYHSADLLELEQPVYELFLAERREYSAEFDSDSDAFWQIAFDRGFDAYLQDYWQQQEFADARKLTQWQKNRQAFEAERDKVGSIRAGIIPAEDRWWTYVTSIFLHGGWDHLIGNMVFLFLFGFTLEVALGPALYFAMYIVCGIAASGLYAFLHPTSSVPLIGASGAISGLMGMYVSLYRLQNIRFFYTLFFYFGELRAPALLVLPLWLCKEIYGHFFTDTNIAYMAHFGGLLAGAAAMFPLRQYLVGFQQEEQTKVSEDEASVGLARIQKAISALDFDRARAIANQLCEKHPQDAQVWRKRFDLAKLVPQTKYLDEAMAKSARQFIESDRDFDLWREEFEAILTEYSAKSPNTPALDGGCYLVLANKYWRKGWRERAEQLLKLAIEKNAAGDEVTKLVELWSREYRKLGKLDKAKFIESFIARSTKGARPIL